MRNKISGIIYTDGRNDKNGVLIAFRYYSLIPLAKSNNQGKTWEKIDTEHDYRTKAANLNNNTNNLNKEQIKEIKKQEAIEKLSGTIKESCFNY